MSIYPAHQTINNWFNPAAFAVPAVGTWGNLGRNIGRGPGYYEFDTALEKETFITELSASREVPKVEAFNLLNHPIYGDPASDISAGSFGIITSVLNSGATGIGTPRRIQSHAALWSSERRGFVHRRQYRLGFASSDAILFVRLDILCALSSACRR